MSLRVAILISGGGSNMDALVRSMTGDHPARPVAVLSNRADAGGLDRARAMGVPAEAVPHRDFASRDAFEQALSDRLAAHSPDLVCLAGFMRVLGAGFVARWRGRVINIHPSLLPLYPGLDTHARAIAAGDRQAGATVHEVTEELDGGPILGQARVPILAGDTPRTLAARVLAAEHRLYPAVLRARASGRREPVYL